MRSTPSLSSFPNVAFETVPMFVWLTMALSRPFKGDRLALPLSTPLSSRRSVAWVCTIIPTCSRTTTFLVPRWGCQGLPQHSLSCQVPSTCRRETGKGARGCGWGEGGANPTHLKYRQEGRQRRRGHPQEVAAQHSGGGVLISWTTKGSRWGPLFGPRDH